jgi:hypothetical protein
MGAVNIVLTKVQDYGIGNRTFKRGVAAEVPEDLAEYLLGTGYFETVQKTGGVKLSTKPAKEPAAAGIEV